MEREAVPVRDGNLVSVDGTDESELAFLAYWRVIQQHKWGILGLILAFGLLSALLAFSLEPVYEAEATLLMDTQRKGFSPVNDDPSSSWMSWYDSQTYLQTQITLFQSRALAEDVAQRLDLWAHPELDPRQEPPRRASLQFDWRSWVASIFGDDAEKKDRISEQRARQIVAEALQGRIIVASVPDTEMIEVRFRSRDPELAARIANQYADAYIEFGLETRLQTVEKAASWLTGRMEGLREKVEESELTLQQYRETHGLVDTEGALDFTDKALVGLSDRLVEARANRTETENLYDQVRQLKNVSTSDLAAHPIILSNATIQALKAAEVDAERKVSELAKRYGSKHPKMVAARSDLSTVRAKLRLEINNAVAAVKKERDIARSRAGQFEKEFEVLKRNAQDVNRKEFALRSLVRDVETNQQLYDMFLTRFKETNLGTDLESANARVIDLALVPDSPVKPRIARIIAAGIFLALLIGVGLAFLVEHLDNTFKRGEDLEEKLRLPLLGSLPLLKARMRKKALPERVFTEHPKSDFAEAIRTVRTGVVLSGLDDPHRVVLVTSTVPGEGKTTVATNLAVALGHLDSVLLIDADLRRASVGAKFGLADGAPGLSNLVAGTAQSEECIHKIEEAGIDVMPSGTIPPNPLELLSSHRFEEMIVRLSESYARIVVDSAPAQAVSDALVLSKICSAVVFVVKSDDTPIPLALLAIKRLRQVDAPLVGAVLNQFDSDKAAKYGYYGKHRRYSDAYRGYSQY